MRQVRNNAALPSYEDLVDRILSYLEEQGAIQPIRLPVPWQSFERLSSCIHDHFEVPATSITPIMRRLLFGLGHSHSPGRIVAAGSYVGYALAWLVRDRSDSWAGPHLISADAVDIASGPCLLAAHNLSVLNHGSRLSVINADISTYLGKRTDQIDLLYLDIDDPITRKAGYVQALSSAAPLLRPGALVLAHDCCVPQFVTDFEQYDHYLHSCSIFGGVHKLDVDDCGLSVAWVRSKNE